MPIDGAKEDRFRHWLWMLLLVAAMFRVVGVWYGLPSLYNSDEPFNVVNALSLGAKQSLEPTYFVYPALYTYFLFVLYGLYFLGGWVLGAFESAVDFGATYFLEPTGLFLVGRLASAVLGVLTVWVVYRVGRQHLTPGVGFLAAVLLTFSFAHVDVSHWILPEAGVAFLVALALGLIFRVGAPPSPKAMALAGLVCGLAISTKYNAGFLIAPLLLAVTWRPGRASFPGIARDVGLSLGSVIFGFLLGSPYWLFSFSEYWHDLTYTLGHVRTGMVGHTASVTFIWPIWELVFVDWAVGFFMVAGLIYALFQRERRQVLLLAYVLPTLLFVGLWTRTGIHYLMPIFPALTLLGGSFLESIRQRVGRPQAMAFALSICLLPALLKIVHYDLRLTQKDTRALAEAWIERHIPQGSTIGYENYVYGPNLFDPDRFLKNASERALLPPEIKRRLLEAKERRIWYDLVNFRKEFRIDDLQVEGSRSRLLNNPYVRQLLSHRLPSLETLRRAGVEYLMISSDNYDRYFREEPPRSDTPLWFSYRYGRQFYESVFEAEDLLLLAEFKPTFWNLGPTTQIYKFKPGGRTFGDDR